MARKMGQRVGIVAEGGERVKAQMKIELTHGELFAGIAGFGLGFAQAGIKTKWHVEIDKNCQFVLSRHFPNELLLSDIRDCGKHNLPFVNIVSFGSPCQGLSQSGKRKGFNDDRSILFFEAIRIVDELKPDFAVWENVPGAFTSNSGRDFSAVLTEFRRIGARDIAWRIIDAQYYALAQRRRRIFLVADFRGERAAQILFERESSAWDTPPRREARPDAAGATSAGVGIGGSELGYALRSNHSHSGEGVNTNLVVPAIAFTQNSRDEVRLINGDGQITGAIAAQHGIKQQNYLAFSESGPGWWRNGIGTLRERDYKDGNSGLICGVLPAHSKRRGHAMGTQQAAESGQIIAATLNSGGNDGGFRTEPGEHLVVWDNGQGDPNVEVSDISYCINGQANQGVGARRLTPLECERLQGFPDYWTKHGVKAGTIIEQSDSARYRQLGNAVAVPVTKWIGQRIIRSLKI